MDEAASPVVSVQGLVKKFGQFRALDGLDLTVSPGEVHGFLGPNGAGKSTTLRALLGLLRTDAGTASVFGLDPWSDAVEIHRRLAYVPGDVALWPNLSGGETIDLLIRMRDRDPADQPSGRAARALRAGPDQEGSCLLQGQPTEGRARRCVRYRRGAADPRRADLRARPADGGGVQRVRRGAQDHSGATVLLSSHILSEVERLADRVTIIREGRAVETGTLEELRHLHRSHVQRRGVREAAGPDQGPRCP